MAHCPDLYNSIKKSCSECVAIYCKKRENLADCSYYPLHLAVNKSEILEIFLKAWVEHDLDINARTQSNCTLLHCLKHSIEGCTKRLEMIIKIFLLEKKVLKLNAEDYTRLSPLCYAIESECLDCIELFLAHGTKLYTSIEMLHGRMRYSYNLYKYVINNASKLGINLLEECSDCTILHIMAGRCDVSAIENLPSDFKYANINKKDNSGFTPLHRVVVDYGCSENKDFIKCIECLLYCGASVEIEDSHGRKPESYASDESIKKILQEWQDLPS